LFANFANLDIFGCRQTLGAKEFNPAASTSAPAPQAAAPKMSLNVNV